MQNLLILGAPPARRRPASPLPAIREALDCVGYRVAEAAPDDGDAICAAFGGVPPDLILADLSAAPDLLPLRHARDLLRDIWGDDAPAVPCIALLTAAHLSRRDWLLYADDFVLPPHAPPEVLSRVELALFRRQRGQEGRALRLADLLLDLSAESATRADTGAPLALTPREYRLLRFLVTHRGKLFPREQILDFVWGVDFEGGERTVDIHIRRLRAKLPPGAATLLETRRGVGYGFLGRG